MMPIIVYREIHITHVSTKFQIKPPWFFFLVWSLSKTSGSALTLFRGKIKSAKIVTMFKNLEFRRRFSCSFNGKLIRYTLYRARCFSKFSKHTSLNHVTLCTSLILCPFECQTSQVHYLWCNRGWSWQIHKTTMQN